MNANEQVAINREGWLALQHPAEGWFFGNEKGVICYATDELARAANTFIYHRNKGRLRFKIVPYQPAPINAGEQEHLQSIEVAYLRLGLDK